MDYEFLKAKMDRFLNETTGEQLIEKFEELGYEFTPNYLVGYPIACAITHNLSWGNWGNITFNAAYANIDWTQYLDAPPPDPIDWAKILTKNTTPNFSGCFILCNIAV
jgi:hypothetical protein